MIATAALLWGSLALAAEPSESLAPAAPKSSAWGELRPQCRWGGGVAVGFHYGEFRWEDIGGSPWNVTASGVVAAGCDLTTGIVRPWVGIESAPTLSTFDLKRTERHPIVSTSAGFSFGPRVFQAGIFGTGGFYALSGGVRLIGTIPGRPGKSNHHLELRVSGAGPVPQVQTMFVYSTSVGGS